MIQRGGLKRLQPEFANCSSKIVFQHVPKLPGKSAAYRPLSSHSGLFWHLAVIRDAVKSEIDLFFAPTSYIIPAFLPAKIKSVITVHDLVAFLHPELHQVKAMILEKLFFRRALKKTSRVLVPSQSTKKDLMRLFSCPEGKITVTPLGAKQMPTREIPFSHIRKKYGLPEEFVLTVSNLSPRKNVRMLTDAFLRVMASRPGAGRSSLAFVIVGGAGWKSQKTQEAIRKAGPCVIRIEPCEDDELAALYQNAKIFVYPSLYEGFGLPPLEAMAAGCPVICSNTSSLPEVCGDAALYFDPKNPMELADALEKLLADGTLRTRMAEKGRSRAQNFTWKKTAAATLAAFNQQ